MTTSSANLRLAPRVLLASAVLLVAAGCTKDKRTPEELITEKLDAAVAALEDKDVKAAAAVLADEYRDGKGRDKKTLKRLAFFVLRSGAISLRRTDETIEVDDDGTSATVSTKVWAVQTSADKKVVADLIPRGRAVEVQLTMKLIDDEWLVTALEGDPYAGGVGG